MPRLRHVDCSEPGLGRRRHGRGFVYVDEHGDRLVDPVELERIKSLVIPPAWTDVWICRLANGHLQAVGTDAAGRRQYLYHPVWREQRDRQKFDEMARNAVMRSKNSPPGSMSRSNWYSWPSGGEYSEGKSRSRARRPPPATARRAAPSADAAGLRSRR